MYEHEREETVSFIVHCGGWVGMEIERIEKGVVRDWTEYDGA